MGEERKVLAWEECCIRTMMGLAVRGDRFHWAGWGWGVGTGQTDRGKESQARSEARQ